MYRVKILDRDYEFEDENQFQWARKAAEVIDALVKEKKSHSQTTDQESLMLSCLDLAIFYCQNKEKQSSEGDKHQDGSVIEQYINEFEQEIDACSEELKSLMNA